MYNIYHKRDAAEALDYALEVFPAVDSPSRPSDGVCVMLLERARALLKNSRTASFEDLKLITKNAMGLFQNVIHRETWSQPAKPIEKDLVLRCINILVWTFAHAKLSLLSRPYVNFVIDLSSELKVCLDSAEQVSTRKPRTVHISAFLNFLRIRDELASPAEYAERWARFNPDVDPSRYSSVYGGLFTCFARLESTVLTVQRTLDSVTADPADPLPIRVVDREDGSKGNSAIGKNSPDGKFSCHLFL